MRNMNFKTQVHNNKTIIAVIAAMIAVCGVFFLAGCAQPQQNPNVDITAYANSVTNVSKDVKSVLSGFAKDVENKDIDAMKSKLDDCKKAEDALNSVNVPEKCKETHQNYVDGFVALQQALSDQIQNFSDLKDGKIDANVAAERTANIQTNYNKGVELMAQADSKIAGFLS